MFGGAVHWRGEEAPPDLGGDDVRPLTTLLPAPMPSSHYTVQLLYIEHCAELFQPFQIAASAALAMVQKVPLAAGMAPLETGLSTPW
jgi:hypothetical protein